MAQLTYLALAWVLLASALHMLDSQLGCISNLLQSIIASPPNAKKAH